MKKILFITSRSFGGSGKYIECLANGLRKKGYWCELLYARSGFVQDKLIESAFDKVHFFTEKVSISPLTILKNVAKVRSILIEGNFDWVHSHTSLGGLIGRLGAAISGNRITVAHTLHAFGADEFTPIPQKWIYWIIEKVLDIFTDIYFCPSAYMREYGTRIKLIKAAKCRVVYNALPLPSVPVDAPKISVGLRRELGIIPGEIVFLFCGRIEKQKGVDVLINALARVDKRLQVKLIICGEGEDTFVIKDLITKHNLWSSVIWSGWQSNLEPFYCCSDVYIMPSRWESFGLVFLEAMNHSLPILSTSVQAIPEVVIHGEVGLLSASEDYVSLANNIECMVSDKDIRMNFGCAGKIRVNEVFAFEKFINDHAAVYEDV